MMCTRSASVLPGYFRYSTPFRLQSFKGFKKNVGKRRILYTETTQEVHTLEESPMVPEKLFEVCESFVEVSTPWWRRLLPGLATLSLLAVLVLLRPGCAMAARSGGRMGGSNFSSGFRSSGGGSTWGGSSGGGWSRNTYSTPMRRPSVQVNSFLFPAYGFGGSSSFFTLIFYAFIAYTLFNVIRSSTQDKDFDYDDEEYASERSSVCKVQVGLLGLARNLQRDLDSLARRADTSSPEGLQYLLQETLLALNRNPDYCVYGASEVKRARSVERAETGFNSISMKERGKIREETLSNWSGRRKETQTTTMTESQIGNELIVVTILVATLGTLQLPTIRSREDLRTALNRLGSIRSRELLAVEVLWTPQDEKDSYTPDELVADYPELCSL